MARSYRTRRRNRSSAVSDVTDLATMLLLFGVAGGVAYLAYELLYAKGGLLTPEGGAGSVDPTTGLSNGPLNQIYANLFPAKFPGGGEAAGTSETGVGATQVALMSPWNAFWGTFGNPLGLGIQDNPPGTVYEAATGPAGGAGGSW